MSAANTFARLEKLKGVDLPAAVVALANAEKSLSVALVDGGDSGKQESALVSARDRLAGYHAAVSSMSGIWYMEAVAEYDAAMADLDKKRLDAYRTAEIEIGKAAAAVIKVMSRLAPEQAEAIASNLKEGALQATWDVLGTQRAEASRAIGPRPAPLPKHGDAVDDKIAENNHRQHMQSLGFFNQ